MKEKINSGLIILHIILYLIVPSFIMAYSFWFDDYKIQQIGFSKFVAVLSIFTLIIYGMYATKTFKFLVHKSTKQTLFLFIPFVVNKILYFYNYSSLSDIERVVMLDGIIPYLGIYTCIFIALVVLVKNAIKKQGFEDMKPGLVALAILLPLFYIPFVYFFIIGWNLSLDYSTETNIVSIAKYIFSICLVVLFHYKMTIEFLKTGKLGK